MHGVKREKVTEAVARARKQAELARIDEYRALVAGVHAKRQAGERDDEALKLTRQVLQTNPEYYTFWNFRREILGTMLSAGNEEERAALLKAELAFGVDYIKMAPKSYWVWYHRVWTTRQMASPPWAKELELCSMMLNLDKRNFHCWDYRRYVRSHIPDAEAEFNYTYTKICQNFSNYSAFHLRTKLMPLVRPAVDGPSRATLLREEFDLVKNAIFTEPKDQSPWLYHRWLLGESADRVACMGAYRVPASGALFIVFSRPVLLEQGSVRAGDLPLTLLPSHEMSQAPSHVWWSTSSAGVQSVTVTTVAGVETDMTVPVVELTAPVTPVAVTEGSVDAERRAGTHAELLESELASIQELLELEPGSKWPLLTSVRLMHALGRPLAAMEPLLDELATVDPYRKAYYADLRSSYACEASLSTFVQHQGASAQLLSASGHVSLSGKQLTTVARLELLAPAQSLDLSHNALRRVDGAHLLFAVESLDVSHNSISTLAGLERMKHLTSLDVSHNNIATLSQLDALRPLAGRLMRLNLSGNPVCDVAGYREYVRAVLGDSLRELDGSVL